MYSTKSLEMFHYTILLKWKILEAVYNVLQSVIEKVSEEKHHHRQAVGCYQTGNVSGPVGKLGRGLVAASNIQTTSTFTFSFKPALSLSHSDQHFLMFYSF